ncbi:hypothetical protein ACRALDRAFT_1082592 [Sodiomyces alcalophilus JCM 7366]|uniref:uncharacterized protein n=1 Tax=Sodiomyces alcalophilus JCM 7366 TaxID=591952 RepID=UPI0039B3A564
MVTHPCPTRRAAAARHLIELLEPLVSNESDQKEQQGRSNPHNHPYDHHIHGLIPAIKALLPTLHADRPLFAAFHDGQVHDPLGAGAYAFCNDLIGPLLLSLANDESPKGNEDMVRAITPATFPTRPIIVHAGAQPNNSPHAGTLVVFCYAFSLARALLARVQQANSQNAPGPKISVEITFVDTAPVENEGCQVDGVRFQRSHRDTPGALATHMADYSEVLRLLSAWSGIPFRTTFQADFFAHPAVPSLLAYLVDRRGRLGAQLSPKSHALALRAACPVPSCALAEKHGLLNQYAPGHISFYCPHHGYHGISLSQPDEVVRLEANAPARNLIRSMLHLLDQDTHHVRITGADYAGTYQEALLYRPLAEWSASTGLATGRTPHILYAPQVVDWSGAKLSKQLYVREGGYAAMELLGTDGLRSYARLKSRFGDEGLVRIWSEVEKWVADPRKLFRAGFSVEYMQAVLDAEGNGDGKGVVSSN